jgi:hypothetical protein
VTRDTRGDGIYVGYQNGSNSPSKGVVINNPDIARAARSGIAAVAGEVTVRRGKINRVGLHGVNVEPNYATGAKSLRITVDRVDIRNVDDITAVPGKGYGVSSGWGYTGVRRPLLKVVDSTGDVLSIAASAMDRIIVTGNRSSSASVFEYWNSGSVTFSGNTNIKKRAS